jgi:hypothetical protein
VVGLDTVEPAAPGLADHTFDYEHLMTRNCDASERNLGRLGFTAVEI